MARADREAALRGVNARYDEAGDDDAVIAALGSPTFAAVSVLRGYTPPEDTDGEEYYGDEEYQYAEPAASNQPSGQEAAGGVPAEEEQEPVNAAPEAEAGPPEDSAPGQVPPEPQIDTLEDLPAEEAHGAEKDGGADEPDGTGPELEETPTGTEKEAPMVQEPEKQAEPEEAQPDENPATDGQPAPAADDLPEAPSGQETPAYETVDIGLGTIEVYSDGSGQEPIEAAQEEEPEEYEEAPPGGQMDEPEAETADEEDGPYIPAENESAAGEPYAEDEVYLDETPEPAPEKTRLRGGRVFACVLLGIVPGVPVAVILILAALAFLALGAALIYAGGVFISFAFLGMGVVADILLTVGFGLFVAAVGLPVVFFAVWFFVRCVVGLCNKMLAKAGAWCRGEVLEG